MRKCGGGRRVPWDSGARADGRGPMLQNEGSGINALAGSVRIAVSRRDAVPVARPLPAAPPPHTDLRTRHRLACQHAGLIHHVHVVVTLFVHAEGDLVRVLG